MNAREPRLVISRRPTRRDHLHGAWWPRSNDVDRELGPMLALVALRFGTVFGVTLNREEWPDAAVAGPSARVGKTKLSWYGLVESHQVVLFCEQSRRIALLVLPPDTPEPVALTATLMASAPGNALSTDETLTRARAQAPASPSTGEPDPFSTGGNRRPPWDVPLYGRP